LVPNNYLTLIPRGADLRQNNFHVEANYSTMSLEAINCKEY